MRCARALGLTVAVAAIVAASSGGSRAAVATTMARPGQGVLVRLGGDDPGAELPLTGTTVRGTLLAFAGHMKVQQSFNNPYKDPIEAVYVFPLPHDAAVSGITVRVGDRTIHGSIKTRAEARKLYEEARDAGKTAVVLEQERPNVFTQSVANIPPGSDVEVELEYDVLLRHEDGVFEFVYPMVVGPRYVPGKATGEPTKGGGTAPDTDRVADGSRVTPPVRKPGTRGGHDVDVEVEIDAGMAIRDVTSPTHEIEVDKRGDTAVVIRLAGGATIPNEDLVVRYRVGDENSGGTLFAHRGDGDGWFAMMMPPLATLADAPRGARTREVVFAIDSSASMDGEPLALAKKAMRVALRSLDRRDRFQIYRFAEEAAPLGGGMLEASKKNVDQALRWVNGLSGEGGTEVIAGLQAAIESKGEAEAETDKTKADKTKADKTKADAPLRMVVILTDGFAANEAEILAQVEPMLSASPDTRVFALGIGSSVNRWLLARLAEVGRGAAEVLLLDEDPTAPAEAFFDRIRTPVLTEVALDWEDLAVADVTPSPVPDVFAGQPLVILGRYTEPGEGTLHVRGRNASGRNKDLAVPIGLPATARDREVLARLWARERIASLLASQVGGERADVVAAVTRLSLDHGVASPYTAFIAVEERVVVKGGVRRTVVVPVEMPEGVIYDGVFAEDALSKKVFELDGGLVLGPIPPAGDVTPGGHRLEVGEGEGEATGDFHDGDDDGDSESGGGSDDEASVDRGVTVASEPAGSPGYYDQAEENPMMGRDATSVAGRADHWRVRFAVGGGLVLDGEADDSFAVGSFGVAVDHRIVGSDGRHLRAGLRSDLLYGDESLLDIGFELGLHLGRAFAVELRSSVGPAIDLDGRLGASFGLSTRLPLAPRWRTDVGLELRWNGVVLPAEEDAPPDDDEADARSTLTIGLDLAF